MNLENDLQSVKGDLTEDEMAVLSDFQVKTDFPESIAPSQRTCRGEFVATAIKHVSLNELVTTISLRNLRIESPPLCKLKSPYPLLAYSRSTQLILAKAPSTSSISPAAESHRSGPEASISCEKSS